MAGEDKSNYGYLTEKERGGYLGKKKKKRKSWGGEEDKVSVEKMDHTWTEHDKIFLVCFRFYTEFNASEPKFHFSFQIFCADIITKRLLAEFWASSL